jgi:hypothetical protein
MWLNFGLDVRPLVNPPIGEPLAVNAGGRDFGALHVGVAKSDAMVTLPVLTSRKR